MIESRKGAPDMTDTREWIERLQRKDEVIALLRTEATENERIIAALTTKMHQLTDEVQVLTDQLARATTITGGPNHDHS
jgi:hypothetical protein